MVHEVSRTEELAERRRTYSFDHVGLEVDEHRAWYVFAARGLVVKHVDAAELRVVVASVLAVAANAVLLAQNIPETRCPSGYLTGRLHVHNLARRKSLEAGSTREKKGGEDRRNVKNSVWMCGKRHRKFRWHTCAYPEREIEVILPLLPLEIWAPCKVRWVRAGAVIFTSATCLLQFAKASAATLSQHEENNSEEFQRARGNISGFIFQLTKRKYIRFICTVAS
jgi:hypothetical protein